MAVDKKVSSKWNIQTVGRLFAIE